MAQLKYPSRHAKFVATLTALCIGLTVAGCSGPSGATQDSSAEPKAGGVLTYLDPIPTACMVVSNSGLYSNGGIVNQVTDKLTYQDPKTLEISPWLATEWSTNKDMTEFTFKLRKDVNFSDGTPLNAEVVAANYDVFGLGNKALGLAKAESVVNYARSEILDDYTVKFYFTSPSPDFLQATSVISSGIVGMATIKKTYDEQCRLQNLVGTGAFTVEDIIPEKQITLARRADYKWGPTVLEHQGPALLEKVKVIVTPEDSVRTGALVSGQADVIRSVLPVDEPALEGSGAAVYAPGTLGVNNSIFLRPGNHILANADIRKAIRLGINREEVVSTLYTDKYPLATSIIASAAKGYIDLSDELKSDPDKAKALLDAAGWKPAADGIRTKDGERLSFNVHYSTAQPLNKEMLELVSQQLRGIGVEFVVMKRDPGTFTRDQLNPDLVGVIPSMVGRAAPDVTRSILDSKSGRNILLNPDTKLDDMLRAQSVVLDTAERNKLLADIQTYVVDQSYQIPMFEEPQVFAAGSKVKGMAFEAVARPSFYSVWLNR